MSEWKVATEEVADSGLRVLRWIYLGTVAAIAYSVLQNQDDLVALILLVLLLFLGIAADVIFKVAMGKWGEASSSGREKDGGLV